MSTFSGFNSDKRKPTPIPEEFFNDLLPEIDDLDELRVTLYAFWNLGCQETEPRYLVLDDLTGDEMLSKSFGKIEEEIQDRILAALEKAVRRGSLLTGHSAEETVYVLNTSLSNSIILALETNKWNPASKTHPKITLNLSRPNIFSIYEKNIGPLTPIISDTLQEAESQYPAEWIEDAVKIAVTRNVRNWRFIEAILRSWKEKGRDEKDQRASQENRKRDSEGEFADYINH
jgi:DNA replication protein